TILIADAIAHTVRVYDERGTFVRSVGRAGEGPGEYGWLTQIMPYTADSIVVMDNENSRVNVLDPQLEFVRRYRPQLRDTRAPAGMTSHRLVSFFADGSALMSDYIDTCGPARSHGFCEDSVSYVRTREDTVLATFGTFVYGRTEARRVERGFATAWTEPHPQPFRTIRGNRFYHADSKRFAVEVYGADGSLERVVRVRAEQIGRASCREGG